MGENHWLERARKEGTPLIEGDIAIFIWEGNTQPGLVGDFNQWSFEAPIALDQIDPHVWIYKMELPQDTYLEYTYLVGSEHQKDPFNSRLVPNGFGGWNQYFYLPEGEPTPLITYRADIPHGNLTRLAVDSGYYLSGKQRSVVLYQPPVPDPVPLVVVWDGNDYLRLTRLPQIVDNLIAEDLLLPVALALVSNHKRARFSEYSANEATLRFLSDRLLPLAKNQLNLVDVEDQPGAFGVMGASLGGLMALFTGLRMPEIFGNVLSQSGGFTLRGQDTLVYDLVRYLPANPNLNIWMSCGRYEPLLETNQRMAVLLKEQGYPVEYNEYNSGHNYAAWRDSLWEGLVHLYRKPDLYLSRS